MPNEGDVPGQKPRKLGLIFIGLLIFIVLLWLITPISYWMGEHYPLIDVGPRGTFGDSFGAINSLFTGLALIGVAITGYLQQRDIEQQQNELKQQNKTLKIQNFEHSFFSMLSAFNDITNSLQLYSEQNQYTRGRDCLRVFHKRLLNKLKKYDEETLASKTSDTNELHLTVMYDLWWEKHRTKLSHYFRTLFHIVKFVHEAEIEDKEKYLKIVRAQLSDQEQALLFYNCLGSPGKDFRQFVSDYALVKHVPDEFLVNQNHKTKFYPKIDFET